MRRQCWLRRGHLSGRSRGYSTDLRCPDYTLKIASELNIVICITTPTFIHLGAFFLPFIKPAPARGKKGLPTFLYGRSYKFFLGNQDINIQDIRRGLGATIEHMDVVKKNNEIGLFLKDELRAFRYLISDFASGIG